MMIFEVDNAVNYGKAGLNTLLFKAEHFQLTIEKVETMLKLRLRHLTAGEIKKRTSCVVVGSVHTYYLDNKVLLTVDYEPKISE